MRNLTKLLLISSIVMLGVAGTLYAATLTIPTKPAKHDAYLSTLILGDEYTGQYTLSGSNLIVPERMIAGGIGGKNMIAGNAKFAVIGGGEWNVIETGAEHSVIGAGRNNVVSATNAIIGAGEGNIIWQNAEGAFIGGGLTNQISSPLVGIAGGQGNNVSAKNTIVLGGVDNTVKAINSLVGGQRTNVDVGKVGTFVYSDFYATGIYRDEWSPTKDNTTIIRAYSGMAINTGIVPAGVNVNVGGAVQMDGQNLLSVACNTGIAGAFEVQNGCFYYCDGLYRQALNVAFNEGTNPANPDASTCGTLGRCEFDGIKLRPGDKVTGYSKERAAKCEDVMKEITCQGNGLFSGEDAKYKHSYCMTWDGTSTGIIETYHPEI